MRAEEGREGQRGKGQGSSGGHIMSLPEENPRQRKGYHYTLLQILSSKF